MSNFPKCDMSVTESIKSLRSKELHRLVGILYDFGYDTQQISRMIGLNRTEVLDIKVRFGYSDAEEQSWYISKGIII